MGTKNNPGKFDRHANAHPDEPMFVLLGRDPSAGAIVRLWAALRRGKVEEAAKCSEARACAAAMDSWAMGLGKEPSGGILDWMNVLIDAAVDEERTRCLGLVGEALVSIPIGPPNQADRYGRLLLGYVKDRIANPALKQGELEEGAVDEEEQANADG